MEAASAIVARMLDGLAAPAAPVALLVNNFGAVPAMEMTLLCGLVLSAAK